LKINEKSYLYLYREDFFNIKIAYLMDMFCSFYIKEYPLEKGAQFVPPIYAQTIRYEEVFFDFAWFKEHYNSFIEYYGK